MRLIISSSGMMVIIILLVIIHNSIISDNYCNMEMNSSINGAFDYASDFSDRPRFSDEAALYAL